MATASAVSLALFASGVALAAEPGPPIEEPTIPAVDSGEQGGDTSTRAPGCRTTFSSGSGVGRFAWCYSDDGNVVSIENSAGLEHVAVGTTTEGWCVSAGGTKRGETYGDFPNFGLDAPTYPSGNRVRHFTTDGDLRITQKFGQSTSRKQIAIRMGVKNVGETTLNNVLLTRFIDADMSNTTGSDVWVSATRSVAVYEVGSSRLQLIPVETNFNVNSMIFASFDPALDADCYNAAADATIEDAGDRSMGVLVQLGNIFPGATKVVTFHYYVAV